MTVPLSIAFSSAALAFLLLGTPDKYPCGQRKGITRPYGNVELRVNCKTVQGRKWVAEFKGNALHGMSQGFQIADGIRRDSCFFRSGREHGTCLVWDSLGSIVGRINYRDGKEIGKKEIFYAAGRPALSKTFDDNGEAEGPWLEWWENGNKKGEFIARKGHIVSGMEYYPNGKPRIRYQTKDEPEAKKGSETKYIEAESWAPNGKPTGKILNGNGEWTHFSAEPIRESGRYNVYREVYKDSIMVKDEKLDSAQVSRWLK